MHALVLSQIVMEKRNFLEFVDDIYRRDELPVWKNVVQLVAAMAAFHHLHCTKVSLSFFLLLLLATVIGKKKKLVNSIGFKSALLTSFRSRKSILVCVGVSNLAHQRFFSPSSFPPSNPLGCFICWSKNENALNVQIDSLDQVFLSLPAQPRRAATSPFFFSPSFSALPFPYPLEGRGRKHGRSGSWG